MSDQSFNQQIYDSVVQLNQNLQNQQASILQLYAQIEQQNEVIKSLQQNQEIARLHQAVEAIIENANSQNQLNKDLDAKIGTVNNNMIEHVRQLNEKLSGARADVGGAPRSELDDLRKLISSHVSKTSIQAMIQELTNQIQRQLRDMASAVQSNLEILQASDGKLEEALNKHAASISDVYGYATQLAGRVEQIERGGMSAGSSAPASSSAGSGDKIQELQQRIERQNEIIGKIQMNSLSVIQQMNENQRLFKERMESLSGCEDGEKNGSHAYSELEQRVLELEKSNNELSEFKSKQQAIFANQSDLENVQQKFKNLKVNIEKQIEQFCKNITDEKEEKKAFIDEVNAKIEAVETSQQAIKEQLKTQSGGNSDSNIPLIEFNEMKLKMKKLDENKAAISALNEKMTKIEKESSEQKDDYLGRLSNLEYVSSKEKEETNNSIKALEEKLEPTLKTINDTPRMISKSIEENEIALNDFKQEIQCKIIDMKAKVSQAKFADEEIDELRKVVNELSESTQQRFEAISIALDENKRALENRKSNEEAISKHEEDICALKATIENLLSKCEVAHTGESYQLSTRNALDVISGRLSRLEERARTNLDNIVRSSESIDILKENEAALVRQIRAEIAQFRDSIPLIVGATEEVLSLKREVQTVQKALNDYVESSSEERERTAEKLAFIDRFSTSFVLPDAGDAPARAGAADSGAAIGDLNAKIDGIDLSTQRQFRKLKRSVAKIQKEIDDRNTASEQTERRHHRRRDGGADSESVAAAAVPARAPALLSGMEQNDYELLFILTFAILLYFLISDLF